MTSSSKAQASQDDQRLRLSFGVIGKHLFRVRERHAAEHLAPLIAARAAGTAKLDLVLRCIALSPQHASNRQPGAVLPQCSWALLHDLAKGDKGLADDAPGMDPSPKALRLKRKWVGQQLLRLEEMNLVIRTKRPGNRSLLIVLRDDGSGEPFDDPDGSPGNTYITIPGSVIASRTLASWGAPELAAFLAAMAAEKSERPKGRQSEKGNGTWFRPLAWFADKDGFYGPSDRVRIPFSVPTLERGISRLEAADLLSRKRILKNPRTKARLRRPRNLYQNKFGSLGRKVEFAGEDEIHEIEEGTIEI